MSENQTNQPVVLDMAKKINRVVKQTRLGHNIEKQVGERLYQTSDGSFGVKVPLYQLKGDEVPIDAVEMNYHMVVKTIVESGDFKMYMSRLRRQNPLVQKVNEYVDGKLQVDNIQSAFMQHLMPAYANKQHIISLELYPDDDQDGNVDWEEMKFGRELILSSSVLNQELIMPLIGKLNIFGSGSNDVLGAGSNSAHLSL